MPRPYIGPRLYQKERRGYPAMWVIRDGGVEVSTGHRDLEKAKAVLDRYCTEKGIEATVTPRTGQRKWPQTTIYFISTNDVPNFPIKIGVSDMGAERRMYVLQNACPYRLTVLASFVGDRNAERELHARFADHRLEREWFNRSAELLALIESLAEKEDAA